MHFPNIMVTSSDNKMIYQEINKAKPNKTK